MKGEGREDEAWVVEDIGSRQYFEDAHSLILDDEGGSSRIIGAIFDGHGGSEVAHLASARFPVVFRGFMGSSMTPMQALESSLLAIDRETVGYSSGAVAVAFHLRGMELSYANAGDAELLLVSRSSCRMLTKLHRLSNDGERMRIIRAGGQIDGAYVMAPSGHGLQCTRSLGDHEFKKVGLIPDPSVGNIRLTEDDLWAIAACDGLWDVMNAKEAAAIARKSTTAREVAEALANEAVTARWTPDNVTVMAARAIARAQPSKA